MISAATDLLKNFKPLRLVTLWKESLGPILLTHSSYLGLYRHPKSKKTCVYVAVPDAMWRMELNFQKNELLQKYVASLQSESFPARLIPEDIEIISTQKMPSYIKSIY